MRGDREFDGQSALGFHDVRIKRRTLVPGADDVDHAKQLQQTDRRISLDHDHLVLLHGFGLI